MNDPAPAACTEGVRIRGDGYTAEAGWFGPEDRPRFGWLYRPDVPAPNGVGIVIVPPFGREEICAHRTLRHLAEDASRAGYFALRFDLDGTGDSAGDDTDPNRIDAWLASIADACNLARSAGAAQLVLIGVRLGATLAALAAPLRRDISAVVAFNAVVSGKSYLRELRALQAAMDLPSAPTPIDESGQESNGFLINSTTCDALKRIDLGALAHPAPNVWMLERDDLPSAMDWITRWRGAGCHVVARRIPGYVEMMDSPHDNRVAQIFIDTCIECVNTVPTSVGDPSVPCPQTLFRRIVLPQGRDRIIEEVVMPADDTFGILTRPATRNADRVVLMLNAGAIRHIGSNRMDVRLSRLLAAAGLGVLRVDFPGIGDSPPHAGAVENIVYTRHAVTNVGTWVGWLRTRGAHEIVAGGMCSGAYHAMRGAIARQLINRVYMVNCGVFGATVEFDPEVKGLFGDIAHYNQSVRSLGAWRRLLTGKVAPGTVIRVAIWHMRQRGARLLLELARRLHLPLRDDLGTDLLAVAKRGTRLNFLYSGTDPGRALLATQAGSAVPRLCRRGYGSMDIFAGADHTFTQRWAQKMLSEKLYALLVSRSTETSET